MNKLFSIFLISIFLISCSSDSVYFLKVVNPYDRITINQIALPGYAFTFNITDEQTFTLDSGMPSGLDDIRVTLTYDCSVGGATYNKDILVNFIENKTTTLTVDRIITCSPQIIVTYD